MSITTANFKQYSVIDGPPTTDVELIGVGGAFDGTSYELDLTEEWVEGVHSFTLNASVPAVTDKVLYGVGGWNLDATAGASTLESARLCIRSAMTTNSTASAIAVRSTSASDTGTVKVYGLFSGGGTIDEITLSGTSTITGDTVFDISSVLWAEYVVGGAATVPVGNITLSADSQVMGVIFGSNSGHGVHQINSLTRVAVATAAETEIGWSSGTATRLDAPDTGVGSFSNAGFWTGNDSSINIEHINIAAEVWFQFCVEITLVADMLLPPQSGTLQVSIMVFGTEG